MRTNAANWLELSERVWHYRRDQLTEPERQDLVSKTDALRQGYKGQADAGKLKLLIEQLEGTLRRVGGKIYPKTALIENVEFFLVAAIVIIGIRTYFVQPFKIPTNSMWPSYYGMTPEAYPDPAKAPGPLAKAARFLMFGARRVEVVAPEAGTVSVPVFPPGSPYSGRIDYNTVPSRSWLIFPSTSREYTLEVNGNPVRVQVPADFNFDWAFKDATGLSPEKLEALAQKSRRGSGNRGARWVELDRKAEAGKPVLSFDILTGDQLFVDRVSYHFMRPQVGQGFVFRTLNIPDIFRSSGDQYYIKRLVGVPGDTLEIKSYGLYRNGQPITGAAAFDKNARQAEKYVGYRNIGALSVGQTMTVPPNSFLAFGDNSADSYDGRYWGPVPAKDVAGRPLFIYYPFTRRWGPAR